MQSFSTGVVRYYSHTQNDMRKKVESMSVKKPVVPAAAEAPAAEAKPAEVQSPTTEGMPVIDESPPVTLSQFE